LVSPVTRFVASLVNAISFPSAERLGAQLMASPSVPGERSTDPSVAGGAIAPEDVVTEVRVADEVVRRPERDVQPSAEIAPPEQIPSLRRRRRG
jgi:hypothetical protein